MDLAGKRVTVMGLGRFGGGIGVTRYLCAKGAEVLVTDLDPADKLTDSIKQIQPLIDKGQVTLRLGEHNVADFTTRDLIVANAAVPKPWDNRFLRSAQAANIPITTEITLLIESLPAAMRERTVAVTGSVGKSTTTAMIHHAMSTVLEQSGGRSLLGGNIGGSLLDKLPELDNRTWLTLELSSAMLYWIFKCGSFENWCPRVGVVTNLVANHLDWHGDLQHYASSKQELLKPQRACDTAILGESVWTWRAITPARAVPIDAATFMSAMKLPGAHNRENAAAALAACTAAMPEVPAAEFEKAIASFTGLTHRLQLVAQTPDAPPIRFYNDSKSTTPESALKAVEALASMPGTSLSNIHLIAGGYDKGSDLSPIGNLADRLGGLYTIGVTGPAIAAAAHGRAIECEVLSRAVAAALDRLHPGDCLLLSPGCASWGQYVNFEARGEEFIKLIRDHLSSQPAHS